jgi:hypothetical protein
MVRASTASTASIADRKSSLAAACTGKLVRLSTTSQPPGASAATSRSRTASRSGRCSSTNRAWTRSHPAAGGWSVTTSCRIVASPGRFSRSRKRMSTSVAKTWTCPRSSEGAKAGSASHTATVPLPAPTSQQRGATQTAGPAARAPAASSRHTPQRSRPGAAPRTKKRPPSHAPRSARPRHDHQPRPDRTDPPMPNVMRSRPAVVVPVSEGAAAPSSRTACTGETRLNAPATCRRGIGYRTRSGVPCSGRAAT